MDPQERNYAYLWDMRESAKLVVRFLSGVKYDDFIGSDLLQSAVERQVELLAPLIPPIEDQPARNEQDHRPVPLLPITSANEFGWFTTNGKLPS